MTNKTDNAKLIADLIEASDRLYENDTTQNLGFRINSIITSIQETYKKLYRTDELYEMTLRQLGDKITELHEAETKLAAIRDAVEKSGSKIEAVLHIENILNTTNAQPAQEQGWDE